VALSFISYRLLESCIRGTLALSGGSYYPRKRNLATHLHANHPNCSEGSSVSSS